MGLFSKKFCDVCGNKIGLLGNRKLEDGNLCKDCAKKLSPWFSERRHSTLNEIKAQLEYREANKAKVADFRAAKTYGNRMKLMVDEQKRCFLVTKTGDLNEENPDVLDFSMVRGCEQELNESRNEKKQRTNDGKYVSYNPPRYEYSYTIGLKIFVDHPYFDEIDFDISNGYIHTGETRMTDTGGWSVRRSGFELMKDREIQKYNDCIRIGNEIKAAIERMQGSYMGMSEQELIAKANEALADTLKTVERAQQISAQNADGSAAASAAWVCPFCDHPSNTGKFCEACGAKRP